VSHASLRITAHEHVRVLMTRGYVDDSLLASSGSGVSLAVWRQWLSILADVNSVNTNDCRELNASCCCVLQFRMAHVLARPEPAALSGNTFKLPHFLVYISFPHIPNGSVLFAFPLQGLARFYSYSHFHSY